MRTAKELLESLLLNREDAFKIEDKEIKEAIEELLKWQDKAQIELLKINAKHKKEINKLKVKFIEDLRFLKED